LFDQGDVPAAIDQWRRSIELNSANADGHAGLGMALYLTGLVAEGQVEYETAVRLNPKYGDEEWLRNAAKWSEEAISASKPLRLQASR
jgi:tetratricopeptide (TPR) repeat protein